MAIFSNQVGLNSLMKLVCRDDRMVHDLGSSRSKYQVILDLGGKYRCVLSSVLGGKYLCVAFCLFPCIIESILCFEAAFAISQ